MNDRIARGAKRHRPVRATSLQIELLEDRAVPDATYHNLATDFFQSWSNSALITTNHNWSGVPSIIGYRGDDLTSAPGVDPQTVVASSTVVHVLANHFRTNDLATYGVTEFDGIANPTIALAGDGTADAPHIVIHLNATGRQAITVNYTLRDLHGGSNNSVQAVALQYRVGESGDFVNVPAGFVADATTGPNLAGPDTPVSVTLPAAVNNQSRVQVRIITTNANGFDEWVGVDNITAISDVFVPVAGTPSVTNATTNEDTRTTSGLIITASATDGGVTTHYKITNIQNGRVFKSDGITQITSGAFITKSEGAAGLKFTPGADLNGVTTTAFGFDVQASLSANNTGLGGSVVAARVTVNAVNDEPSFTLPVNSVTVNQDSGAFSRSNFATTIQVGPATATDESGQSVTFNVLAANQSLFSGQPTISDTGTLQFTLAPGASGSTRVAVTLQDSGGTANGGDNTSGARSFTITVNPAPVIPPPAAERARIIVLGSDAGIPARIRVLDVNTRAVTREFAPFDGYVGGVRVAAGDVNGDGTTDIIAATATEIGHVKVFDGATGALLRSFMPFGGNPSGLNVAGGDVDGDRADDIVIAVETGPSHVMAFSGRTGAVLHSFFAYPGFLGGVQVAAGDVNGDGRADIATVAGPGGNGHVKVFDGRTGAPLASFLGYENYEGETTITTGDVTGDGLADVIIAARNPLRGTHVKAFSARTNDAIFSFTVPLATDTRGARRMESDVTQTARVAAGDVTGDGIADIVLSDPPGAAASKLLIVNGATRNVIESRLAFDALFAFGVSVDVD